MSKFMMMIDQAQIPLPAVVSPDGARWVYDKVSLKKGADYDYSVGDKIHIDFDLDLSDMGGGRLYAPVEFFVEAEAGDYVSLVPVWWRSKSADTVVELASAAEYGAKHADNDYFPVPLNDAPAESWFFLAGADDNGASYNDANGQEVKDYWESAWVALDDGQSAAGPGPVDSGMYSVFYGYPMPQAYGSMTSLEGRAKVDTTQIKHRLSTADYANGGYKPSMPAGRSGEADYKAFPPQGTITALRQAAEGGAASTIPFVVEMDMIEAQLANLLDSDGSLEFDAAPTIWKAESSYGNNNRKTLRALQDLEVAADMNVGNDLKVTGHATADGSLTVNGSQSVFSGDLQVQGTSTLIGAVDAQASLNVAGTSQLTGAVTAVEDIQVGTTATVTTGVEVGTTLSVGGQSTFDGDVTMASAGMTDLVVEGSADFGVSTFTVDASDKIMIESDKADATAVHLKAAAGGVKLEGQNGVFLTGNTTVSDDLQASGDLSVGGASNFSSAVSAAADLDVQGTSVLNGGVTMHSTLDVDGDIQAGANMTIQDQLTVKGDSLLQQDLTVGGASLFKGDVSVNGQVDINASSFDLDTTSNILIQSSASDDKTDENEENWIMAVQIEATDGSVKIAGSGGISIEGVTEFEDDLTISDSLVLESADNGKPDFMIVHDGTELVHFDTTGGGMEAEFTGDVTIGGKLIVQGAIEVNGDAVEIISTATTLADNILEINKDNDGDHESVGILLDAQASEKDFFFGINKSADRFVLTKEASANDWSGWTEKADENKKSDPSNNAEVDAADLHIGSLRSEGLAQIAGDLKVGTSGSEVLKVEVSGAKVSVGGDLEVDERASFVGDLEVTGDADISKGLIVEGEFKADSDGASYLLTVDSANSNGLEDAAADGRITLSSGDAHIKLQGDLEIGNMLAERMVIDGEFQARGKVGLGKTDSAVTVYGKLDAKKSAEFESALKVHTADGGTSYSMVADDGAQQEGLSIESRALKASSDAFLTLADGKDFLLQGDLGVKGDAIVGGDIWYGDYLKSKAHFLMQDSFIEGNFATKSDGNQDVVAYSLAGSADHIQAVLNNSAEALVDIGSGQKDHISIMGVLSGLISGGSTLRYEYELTDMKQKGVAFSIGEVIHDNSNDQSYQASLRLFLNGQRLSDSDYELVADAGGDAGKLIKFNFTIEKDDVLIIDINDSNPAA